MEKSKLTKRRGRGHNRQVDFVCDCGLYSGYDHTDDLHTLCGHRITEPIRNADLLTHASCVTGCALHSPEAIHFTRGLQVYMTQVALDIAAVYTLGRMHNSCGRDNWWFAGPMLVGSVAPNLFAMADDLHGVRYIYTVQGTASIIPTQAIP